VNVLVSLSNLEYGTNPNNLITLPDCSNAWFEEQQMIVPLSNIALSYSSQGPLAFGGYGIPRQQVFTKYTYIAGYVNNPIATATQGIFDEAGQYTPDFIRRREAITDD
jgi:hypothetical protein